MNLKVVLISEILKLLLNLKFFKFIALITIGYIRLKVNVRGGEILILSFSKPFGEEDLDKALELSELYKCVKIPRFFPRLIVEYFSGGISPLDTNYIRQLDGAQRNQIMNFWLDFLSTIRALYPKVVLVHFNIVYFSEREVYRAAQKLGVPGVLIQKESIRPAASWRIMEKTYQKIVDMKIAYPVCVYNYEAKAAFVKANLVEEANIFVTGCPRAVFVTESRYEEKNRKDIVIFAIDPKAGLPNNINPSFDEQSLSLVSPMCLLNDALQPKDFHQLVVSFVKIIREVIKMYPDYNFLLKFKGATIYKSLYQSLLDMDNCIETNLYSLNLINEARLCVGFNSTVLLESIGLGVPAVSPHVQLNGDRRFEEFQLDIHDAVPAFNCSESLALAIQHPFVPSLSVRRRVFDKYLHNSDGEAATRLDRVLRDAVNLCNE